MTPLRPYRDSLQFPGIKGSGASMRDPFEPTNTFSTIKQIGNNKILFCVMATAGQETIVASCHLGGLGSMHAYKRRLTCGLWGIIVYIV